MSTLLQDLLMFFQYGGKQLYYFNTFDGQGEMDIAKLVASGEVEEDCESCKI